MRSLLPGLLGAALLAIGPPAPFVEEDGRAPTPAELRPGVEAAFEQESYRPGSIATLAVFGAPGRFTYRVYRSGPETAPTRGDDELAGVPVTAPATGVGATRIRVGDWPSGLYFARLESAFGLAGFAPFVVAPRRLGEHRVAVVLPTLTWQAYNLRDGGSWYASWSVRTVHVGRPFLDRGVPPNYRRYDLPFLHWLARTGWQVDVLADADLDAVPSGEALARAYDLVVFPGHHEYVTDHEYDVVRRYRDLGGHLAFLSANDFFWRVVRHGGTFERTSRWRDVGRPEASLIGVQYRANDRGTHRAPWIVRAAPAGAWLFAGTGLAPGAAFESGGIEIDATSPASPPGVQVLAEIPDLFGAGFTAQMTYYETPAGAEVFAAGAFRLVTEPLSPVVSQLLHNLWLRMATPRKEST